MILDGEGIPIRNPGGARIATACALFAAVLLVVATWREYGVIMVILTIALLIASMSPLA